MPACPFPTFIPDPVFVFPVPPPVPPPVRKRPRKPRPKPRPKGRVRLGRRVLPGSLLSVLIDRVDQAVEAGVIDLHPDDGATPCDRVEITTAGLALLLAVLFPEEYSAPRKPARATATAPGSADRVAEYARRVEAGERLFTRGDARADGIGKGLAIVQRRNGSGVRVLGWEGDPG